MKTRVLALVTGAITLGFCIVAAAKPVVRAAHSRVSSFQASFLTIAHRSALHLPPAGTGLVLSGWVQFLSSRDGFVLARRRHELGLLATNDVGVKWHPVPTPPGLEAVDMVSLKSGWVLLAHNPGQPATQLEFTRDGGRLWQRPLASWPRGRSITAMDFLSNRLGWVELQGTGPNGLPVWSLEGTKNGGTTWTPLAMPRPVENTIAPIIEFISPSIGWMLCSGEPSAGFQEKWLYQTTNGGRDWHLVASSTNNSLSGGGYASLMSFVSPAVGYLSFARGSVFRTQDGGRHWIRVTAFPFAPQAEEPLSGMSFVTSHTGFAVVAGTLWRTSHGGTSWDPLAPSPIPTGSISFASVRDGYTSTLVGGSALMKTVDGGARWVPTGPPQSFWNTVQMTTPTTVWATGIVGNGSNQWLYVSRGGGPWRRVVVPTRGWILGTAMTSSGRGWVLSESSTLGLSDLFYTASNGRHWEKRALSFPAQAIAAPTPSDIWIAGSTANDTIPLALYHSSDGGLAWETYRLPDHAFESVIGGITFRNTQWGWFWTASSLYVTHNGGHTWDVETTHPIAYIEGADFVTAQDGWLTTSSGLYHTTDGGATWISV
ncbi:MAG: hypothetical protein C7B45_05865 [Sulfobacillus acidophilus]|uniref:Photosynthesis system II assembly factor Ycf48/Hcf136-like domain-containing protein n=1 Tax=Sulfobacillus acidophilus TaxID=53633 RepID=A0A2T2WKG4_9FIRM|nr:MAG: hypothetical protein C7B45_05865 [Sulfobacillus acidophilus]